MAGGFSDYLELGVLDHVFGGPSFTKPASLYVALFVTAPTDSGGGTELSGGDYARVAVTNDSTNWPAAASGTKVNGLAITFPTATSDLGTANAIGIFDAASGGNLICWTDLSSPRPIVVGDTPSFAPGDIVITLN